MALKIKTQGVNLGLKFPLMPMRITVAQYQIYTKYMPFN